MSFITRCEEVLKDLRTAEDLLEQVLDQNVGGEAPPSFYHLLEEITSFIRRDLDE